MQIKVNLKIFLFLILFILTHQIEIYGLLMLFACIHEMGHLFAGILLKLQPKKLTIMPFGLSVIFEEYTGVEKLNLKKMLIAMAGPAINIVIAIIFLTINRSGLENIVYANIIIAIFNLLPIYPLDGGRILKYFLRIKLDAKSAERITHIVTNVTLIAMTAVGSIITFTIKNIAFFLILCYLWSLVIKENKRYTLKEKAYEILDRQRY